MGAGSKKQGYIPNYHEQNVLGKFNRLSREDMKGVPMLGSVYEKVYVCSPFAAYGCVTIQENIKRAKEYCRYVIRQKKQPVASHLLYPQILDDSKQKEREMGLAFGLSLLKECSEVYVFCGEDGMVSDGMRLEIAYARRLMIPVKYINDPKAYGKGPWNPIKSYDEKHNGSEVDADGVDS